MKNGNLISVESEWDAVVLPNKPLFTVTFPPDIAVISIISFSTLIKSATRNIVPVVVRVTGSVVLSRPAQFSVESVYRFVLGAV